MGVRPSMDSTDGPGIGSSAAAAAATCSDISLATRAGDPEPVANRVPLGLALLSSAAAATVVFSGGGGSPLAGDEKSSPPAGTDTEFKGALTEWDAVDSARTAALMREAAT